ncbi:hypothetical protein EB821_02695 [Candidatus Marinimicrobia bacterium PRS2]|nr:hypothetical protein EB821_02695 [Candidatus Marinimicrobia bacterium PRS2]
MLRLVNYIAVLMAWGYTQSFVVEPYLQNAMPNSIYILWETDSNADTRVEWGTSTFLGNNTSGTAFYNTGNSQIHTVLLNGLDPGNRYYYRAVTSNLSSEIYDFITPSDPSSESSLKIIAMSDMQKDWSNWDKYDEIIHEGIIDYLTDEYSDDLPEELQMILIAGDLVDTGSNYTHWVDHFFSPSAPLFAHVPLYPVLGNHEANTNYYFKYFNLPENGSAGYEEHWWYTDNSNLRVIGLDSNWDFQLDVQLNWLEDVLTDACYNPQIDFVFAQLHHPYKSELWVDGNTDYTGQVISMMEAFTDECGKPSIHFFGHTHGYSRGQSQDHEHLMVNVATAGGAIDYWGEWSQADYSEFTVSQDEWGFVLVEVNAGDDPDFTLKRISRGNRDTFRDNEIRDEVYIKLHNEPPVKPEALYPVGNNIEGESLMLEASEFIDNDGDDLSAAQWRLYKNCEIEPELLFDEFVNQENWYFYEDTQESVELGLLPIQTLDGSTSYCWQVRYRDSSLGWSPWSDITDFQTTESQYTANLLLNAGAENGTDNWIVHEGFFESLIAYQCDGVEPYNGNYYFAVGAICNSSYYAEVSQTINISEYADCISNGLADAHFGGYLSNWGGSDHPEMQMIYLDEFHNEIESSPILDTYNSSWTFLSNSQPVPEETAYIQILLMGTRYAGSDNDSYFDDLFVKLFRDESCMTTFIAGDLNQDEILNILDIIIMVNIILEGNDYQLQADMNEDGSINILDIITLVNIILEM